MRSVIGVACLAAVAVGLAGCGGERAAMAAPAVEAGDAYPFRVEIDGKAADDVFLAVRGLAQAIGSTDMDSPDRVGKVSAPDGARPSSVVFEIQFNPESLPAVQTWVQETYAGADVRKTISVVLLKRDGSEARRFNLLDCYPTRFAVSPLGGTSADTGTVVHWTLEVRVNRIEMA
jgi:hypothetical protein